MQKTRRWPNSPLKVSVWGIIMDFNWPCLERAELVDQIGREIEVLERPENLKVVNPEKLREAQLKISELFVVSFALVESILEIRYLKCLTNLILA